MDRLHVAHRGILIILLIILLLILIIRLLLLLLILAIRVLQGLSEEPRGGYHVPLGR